MKNWFKKQKNTPIKEIDLEQTKRIEPVVNDAEKLFETLDLERNRQITSFESVKKESKRSKGKVNRFLTWAIIIECILLMIIYITLFI